MKNLKIRFIKINDKYTMEFKRFGLWVRATVPNKDMVYSIVKSISPSKCLNRYLYSINKSRADFRITEYPTIKKY